MVKHLSGWWYTYPSEEYESQLGWLFPIYGNIKFMFQTTNQICNVGGFGGCICITQPLHVVGTSNLGIWMAEWPLVFEWRVNGWDWNSSPVGLCVLIRLTPCELPQLSHGNMPTSQSHYTGWLMGIRDSLGSNVWIHSNQAHDFRRHIHRETINNILRRAVKKHLQVANSAHFYTACCECGWVWLTLRWLWTKAQLQLPWFGDHPSITPFGGDPWGCLIPPNTVLAKWSHNGLGEQWLQFSAIPYP